MTGLQPAEPAYVVAGRRGQDLLDRGKIPEAVAAFEAVLRDLGEDDGYGRALLLERLGRARLVGGDPESALASYRASLELAGHLSPTETVQRLRCAVRSGMGDAHRAAGRPAEARRSYLAALDLGEHLHDPRSRGVDQARLGALALAQGDLNEALARHRLALEALRTLREPPVEAVAHDELARVYQRLGDLPGAVRHAREAVACERRIAESPRLARRLLLLAGALRAAPDGAREASRAASEALELAIRLEPTGADVWSAYRLLGEIHPDRPAFAEIGRRGPEIVAALARVGDRPGSGRAVLLGRLGRCFAAGDRVGLAAGFLEQAVRAAADADLLAMLWEELGDLRARESRTDEAAGAFAAALACAERSGDHVTQERMRTRLGRPPLADPEPEGAAGVVVLEETTTDFAFDPNLLLDGPRVRRRPEAIGTAAPPAEASPMLVPGTRTWLGSDGRVRFVPPAAEPEVLVDGPTTTLRRTSREVAVRGSAELVWRLLGLMDGRRAWAEILAAVPDAERTEAEELVSRLAAAGVVDVSGRPYGRFIHWATRKGVLPAGGLEGDEAFRLAADARPARPDSATLPLPRMVPERLRPFHALTRARRSTREYRGELTAAELGALLDTACGVTGSLTGPGGEVKLRAYPSSGALYAVGIYPVAFRVESVAPGVYRYDAERHGLDPVSAADLARFVEASLPMEREMMAGAALLVCLTGMFRRHERKYGEGGYRMLVAEAGHVSANLVLAATALGLHARPFGGVFDALADAALGVDAEEEQFLLSVLVGR